MKYWEIIADNLSKAGWSWGCVSAIDSSGRTIWIVDAHRDNGKRFVVHADESRGFVKVTIMLLSNSCNFHAIVRNKSVGKFKAVAICLTLGCALAVPVNATTITVTNTSDNGPGSLRQALANANHGDTIDATGISGVITLTSGQLLVDKSVTINGAGADMLAIDGNMASRIFQIGLGQTRETVTISGLTIRNAQGNFGGSIFITNAATATIINCTVSGSIAGFGGGIFNDAALVRCRRGINKSNVICKQHDTTGCAAA